MSHFEHLEPHEEPNCKHAWISARFARSIWTQGSRLQHCDPLIRYQCYHGDLYCDNTLCSPIRPKIDTNLILSDLSSELPEELCACTKTITLFRFRHCSLQFVASAFVLYYIQHNFRIKTESKIYKITLISYNTNKVMRVVEIINTIDYIENFTKRKQKSKILNKGIKGQRRVLTRPFKAGRVVLPGDTGLSLTRRSQPVINTGHYQPFKHHT